MTSTYKKIISLIIFIAIIMFIGFYVGSTTATNIPNWFNQINQPSFAPPNWLFAPVWSVIYILIAIAGWLMMTRDKLKGKILTIYIIQMLLNYLWSFIFFSFHNIGLALLEMSILWVFVAWNIKLFMQGYKPSGYLMVPYLLWLSFAWILNLSYFVIN